MKKQITVQIESKRFTISELTVEQIIELSTSTKIGDDFSMLVGEGMPLAKIFTNFTEELKIILEKSCDFSLEDLKQLAPSEIKQLFEAFKEVNADFLLLLREVGVIPALVKIKEQMATNFLKALAD